MAITQSKSPQYSHRPFEPTVDDVAQILFPLDLNPANIPHWEEWDDVTKAGYEDAISDAVYEEQQAWIEKTKGALEGLEDAPSPLFYAMEEALRDHRAADRALSQLAALAVQYAGQSAASIERQYAIGHTVMTRRIAEGDTSTVRKIAAQALRRQAASFTAAADSLENGDTATPTVDE